MDSDPPVTVPLRVETLMSAAPVPLAMLPDASRSRGLALPVRFASNVEISVMPVALTEPFASPRRRAVVLMPVRLTSCPVVPGATDPSVSSVAESGAYSNIEPVTVPAFSVSASDRMDTVPLFVAASIVVAV